VTIPVVYDGPDLADVASRTDLSVEEVVRRHAAGEYVVAFCGFAPGFGYLTGLDPALCLPRRTVPRTRIPAGSVAVADRFTSVYPSNSPGGWHLLGRTATVMWDLERQPPALLAPGTRVRFEAT
jgi:KipI family sensor histidine kinase inhibitor